jgi:hypothetical protein
MTGRHHCIQCSAGDVSMLSETVHGRLLVTRNAQLTRRHAIKADWLVVLSRSRLQAVFRLFLVSLVVSFV